MSHRKRFIFAMTFASLLVVAGVIAGVMAGYGSSDGQTKRGSAEVFYTRGVTKAQADRLGDYIQWTWDNLRAKVHLEKSNDGYRIRMVSKKDDETTLRTLEFDAARVSRDVFDGAAVELDACDDDFKTIRAIPPRADVRYGLVDRKAEVFYANPADKADAEKLTEYLANVLTTAPVRVSFKLAKRNGTIQVHMVTNPDSLKDANTIAALRNDRANIAVRVFPGTPVELVLCDRAFNALATLK